MLKRVAITGGLASGKSTACSFLKQLGAYVISADEIVHQLLTSKNKIGQQVIQTLGQDIVAKDGSIDRSLVAKKVFSEPKQLKKLESILHPAVQTIIKQNYQSLASTTKETLFVVEIPLLFEAQMDHLFDVTVSISTPKETCHKHFIANGKKDTFDARNSRLLSSKERDQRANIVIPNKGSKDDLKKEMNQLYKQLTSS